MKCKFWLLAVTLSSLYAATRSDHVEDMLSAENACMVKHPSITPATLNELKEVKDIPKFQASHPELSCFMLCVGVELKLVDNDGVLNVENMKKFMVDITGQAMTDDAAHAAVTECTTVASVHEDKCERAARYTICKVEQLKDFALKMSKHDV